jgi:tRNA nucleotidyltransferase (CCA-adding enzyme)
VIFPEVDRLFGVPQPAEWHPEVDTGDHVLLCLHRAAQLGASTAVRFAALAHDLGKGLTPRAAWPKHHGHEGAGLPLVDALCDRLKVPAAFRELARLACQHHGNLHRAFELRADTLLELLERCDAFRRPERFGELLLACQIDAQGRTGREDTPYPQRDYMEQVRAAATAITLTDADRDGLAGPQIAAALRLRRLAIIEPLRGAARAARGLPATAG